MLVPAGRRCHTPRMSAVLERGPAGAEDTAPAPHRRRRWPWIVAALLVVLAVAVAVFVVRQDHAAASALESGGGSVFVTSKDLTVNTRANVYGIEYVVVHPDGGDVASAWFGLVNGSDKPVTITALGFPGWMTGNPPYVGYLASTKAYVAAEDNGIANLVLNDRIVPPRGFVQAKVVMTFARCGHRAPGRTSITDVTVTYEVSGKQYVAQVPLGYALSLASPGQCGFSGR